MTYVDWLIITFYFCAVLLLGLRAGRGQTDDTDYYLAGRSQSWQAVAASTWATKLSALTFIGVPGAAIAADFAYVQLWFGSFLAAYVVAVLFMPEFYRHRVFTVYEYLGIRLGPASRLGGTLVFIISRCLASGVRLAGCAIAVSVFFDLSLLSAIALIATVAAIYVLCGGLKAVIWTDALQLLLFLAGAAIALIYIAMQLPGGFAQIWDSGQAASKFRVFNFDLDLADGTTFWMGNLFAFFLGLAVGAADQDIAQRALSCRNSAQAKIALISAGAADLISTLLFLSVGVAVFAFYQAYPQDGVTALLAESRYDYIFPHFIRHELPAGLRGLLVAALFAAAMSSLDSALSGLASSAHFDLNLGRFLTRRADQARTSEPHSGQPQAGSRFLVVGFAVLLAAIAAVLGSQPSILWFGLKIMGYTYGGLLGLFVVAYALPQRTDDMGNLIAVFSSIFVVVAATHWYGAPWPWTVLIGLSWTCFAAILLGGLRNAARR